MKSSHNGYQFLSVDNNFTNGSGLIQDDWQKRRKLTVDSGYEDDLSESKDNEQIDQTFTRTLSLDSISEDSCDSMRNISPVPDAAFPTDGSEEMYTVNSRTKEKRRRMTPVPGNVQVAKPSKGSPAILEKSNSFHKILFVEEEDHDDIEKYNYEDDFICPDIQTQVRRLSIKRNSWHGITDCEKTFRRSNRGIFLTKSKSLDRGCDYPRRRRKRFAEMSIPSISLEELSLDCKRPIFRKQQSLQDTFKENRKCFDNESKMTNEENMTNNLPAWMRNAVKEGDGEEIEEHSTSSSSSDTEMMFVENDEEIKNNTNNKNELFSKLEIPQIDWQKLHADKNKANKLLSEQRKAFNKEKTKASSRRRRKLTPSESPSHSSLEKLSSLRSASEELTVTEEEEEEEES